MHQDGGQDLEALADNLGITDCVQAVDQYRYHGGLVQPSDLNGLVRGPGCAVVLLLWGGVRPADHGGPGLRGAGDHDPGVLDGGTESARFQVGGEPFWNGVHKAWWVKPSIPEMVAAFERSYAERDKVDRDALRAFAGEYAVDVVADRFMKPAVDELLGRMAARKG